MEPGALPRKTTLEWAAIFDSLEGGEDEKEKVPERASEELSQTFDDLLKEIEELSRSPKTRKAESQEEVLKIEDLLKGMEPLFAQYELPNSCPPGEFTMEELKREEVHFLNTESAYFENLIAETWGRLPGMPSIKTVPLTAENKKYLKWREDRPPPLPSLLNCPRIILKSRKTGIYNASSLRFGQAVLWCGVTPTDDRLKAQFLRMVEQNAIKHVLWLSAKTGEKEMDLLPFSQIQDGHEVFKITQTTVKNNSEERHVQILVERFSEAFSFFIHRLIRWDARGLPAVQSIGEEMIVSAYKSLLAGENVLIVSGKGRGKAGLAVAAIEELHRLAHGLQKKSDISQRIQLLRKNFRYVINTKEQFLYLHGLISRLLPSFQAISRNLEGWSEIQSEGGDVQIEMLKNQAENWAYGHHDYYFQQLWGRLGNGKEGGKIEISNDNRDYLKDTSLRGSMPYIGQTPKHLPYNMSMYSSHSAMLSIGVVPQTERQFLQLLAILRKYDMESIFYLGRPSFPVFQDYSIPSFKNTKEIKFSTEREKTVQGREEILLSQTAADDLEGNDLFESRLHARKIDPEVTLETKKLLLTIVLEALEDSKKGVNVLFISEKTTSSLADTAFAAVTAIQEILKRKEKEFNLAKWLVFLRTKIREGLVKEEAHFRLLYELVGKGLAALELEEEGSPPAQTWFKYAAGWLTKAHLIKNRNTYYFLKIPDRNSLILSKSLSPKEIQEIGAAFTDTETFLQDTWQAFINDCKRQQKEVTRRVRNRLVRAHSSGKRTKGGDEYDAIRQNLGPSEVSFGMRVNQNHLLLQYIRDAGIDTLFFLNENGGDPLLQITEIKEEKGFKIKLSKTEGNRKKISVKQKKITIKQKIIRKKMEKLPKEQEAEKEKTKEKFSFDAVKMLPWLQDQFPTSMERVESMLVEMYDEIKLGKNIMILSDQPKGWAGIFFAALHMIDRFLQNPKGRINITQELAYLYYSYDQTQLIQDERQFLCLHGLVGAVIEKIRPESGQ